MGMESPNTSLPQEKKPMEAKKDEPKTLEDWVEKQLSELMTRRIAGEDVSLVEDLPHAPEDLVKENYLRTEFEAEKIANDYIKLMEDALNHPSADNFYSVWLESQGPEAKDTLKILLENPDRIRQEIKEYVNKSKAEDKEKLESEKVFRSPFERVADRLKEAQQTLQQEGLTEDASHIDEIIAKLEKINGGDFNTTIELWDGESIPPNKRGWYPEEKTKDVILKALGTSYKRTNSQFDDLDINYYSNQFHTDRVKLEVRENKTPVGQGLFSKASVVFPSEWYQEKKQQN